MSDRRYEVYETCPGCATVGGCGKRTRLDSIPDALVEEAAKRLRESRAAWLRETNDDWLIDSGALARAALSVLFPEEEE